MMEPIIGSGIPHKQRPLAPFLAPAWAQCWSFNPGSDTLLRAYSRVILDPLESRNVDPRNEGVTVTTTPRRLASALAQWASNNKNFHFVIGRVTYKSEELIGKDIVNIVNGKDGPGFFRSVQGRAESLLWKRDFFRHEEEVRLICLQREGPRDAEKFKSFPIDPNEAFAEISFDPRLKTFERREREAEIQRLGYKGELREDRSYIGTFYQLQMLKDWPEP
jgi:hypothetical protein